MSRRHSSLVMVLALAAAPAMLQAQADSSGRTSDSSVEQVYEAQRMALIKQLQATQDQLSQLRGQRVALEAEIDNALAQTTAKRADQLLMSTEQSALVDLDKTLSTAQDNMQSQRDRMSALGDAVKRRSGAVLVVLLRADSSQTSPTAVAMSLDGGPSDTRTYSAIATEALSKGAVDELFRSAVLPLAHTVDVQVTVNGQSVTARASVNAQVNVVTYLQFTVRNGQVVPNTWTSQGTTPF
jgi:cytochrome c556